MIRAAVVELTRDVTVILSDDEAVCSDATVAWAEALTRTLHRPATDEEALALLPLLARADESSCHGLLEALLHFVESAPDWPPVDALRHATGPWPDLLRLRLTNSGRWLG